MGTVFIIALNAYLLFHTFHPVRKFNESLLGTDILVESVNYLLVRVTSSQAFPGARCRPARQAMPDARSDKVRARMFDLRLP